LSLRLLIDEDSQSSVLVAMLRSAGHDVRTANDESLDGRDDVVVLAHAHASRRALLTKNAEDYEELHSAGIRHSGILAIYESANRAKNMTLSQIVRAVCNLEQAGLDLAGQFVPLNAWNF
jgi:predicted nuclease of predicted toxin-antitoxin system